MDPLFLNPDDAMLVCQTLLGHLSRAHLDHHAALYACAALVAQFGHKWMPLVYVALTLAALAGS